METDAHPNFKLRRWWSPVSTPATSGVDMEIDAHLICSLPGWWSPVSIPTTKRVGRRYPPTMATDSTRRLHHATPAWVRPDAVFHIRGRVARPHGMVLVEPQIAPALLESVEFYHRRGTWFCHLFLLMPDHWHALLCFPPASDMRIVVGRWKAWHTRQLDLEWQDNFFDHRLRNRHEMQVKAEYIRQNPVVKGLCKQADDWPWKIDVADSR